VGFPDGLRTGSGGTVLGLSLCSEECEFAAEDEKATADC